MYLIWTPDVCGCVRMRVGGVGGVESHKQSWLSCTRSSIQAAMSNLIHTHATDTGNTQLNGKDVEAIADRAHVWSLWGKTDRAICGYEQALRLSPPHPEVHLLRLAEECLRTSTELT